MIGKRFAVRLTAVAVIGAFGPALAQSYEINANPNKGVDANVGIVAANSGSTSMDQSSATGSTSNNPLSGSSVNDQSVTSGVTANQSSTDVNSSSTMDQSASSSQSSSQASTDSTQAGSAASGATASGDDRFKHGKGLDRADEVAGEHGQHGRDNARSNQAGG